MTTAPNFMQQYRDMLSRIVVAHSDSPIMRQSPHERIVHVVQFINNQSLNKTDLTGLLAVAIERLTVDYIEGQAS